MKDRADQISGYDEKYVDPDIATGKAANTCVPEHDRSHSNGTQAIDISPVINQLSLIPE